ncbi:MAG: zinc dependent phospholipase C family protein [Oscillospiraceae bacterium]|nr:zinc dependent phospholipase C family protein [Oscillospiraceae bacterium]RKJ58573.1 hypothetical protein D7X25_01095 [bacterium 1XD42-8]RKJ67701.1 hypothetical protein D7Y09_00870 [bacterium 1XD42-1]
MNCFSHITMGRYLYQYFRDNMDIRLKKRTFVLWNVMPDLAPSLLRLSHFKKDIYDLVMEKAQYLAREGASLSPSQFSKQMGILCHFMSDFFCYAHAEYFDGGKIAHFKYEIGMQLFGYRNREMLHAVDLISHAAAVDQSLALYEQINKLHEQYREIAPSWAVDFIYSLTACVDLMMGMKNKPVLVSAE